MADTLTKHWRFVSLVLGGIIALWVLYLLRSILLPFAFGLVLAYLLMPVVSWMERSLPRPGKWVGPKRIFSLLVTFVVLIGIVSVFIYFIATAVFDASVVLLESAPNIISRSLYQMQEWLEIIRQQFPPEIRQELDKTLLDAGVALGNMIRDAVLTGITFVPKNFSIILGFAALPFFLFYIMKDAEKLKKGMSSVLTPRIAEHARNVVIIVERVLGRYIRAQLMLGLIVGYFAFVGLLILRVPFAPVLAILAGLTELVPTLGPWIGGGAAVIVTLAIAPEKALWVAVLYLGIQLFENSFLTPRVQGAYMHIHPGIMIFLLVLGAYIAGFWGLVLVGPLTATTVEIYKYIHRCCTAPADPLNE